MEKAKVCISDKDGYVIHEFTILFDPETGDTIISVANKVEDVISFKFEIEDND